MNASQLADLELRHLVALQAVAEARSFGKAAARLGYTQSAVSQQIAALERTVGEPLFERPGGPKPVRLTRAGELVLQHAEAVLAQLRNLQADLASFQAGRLGRLAVGTFQSVSVRVLPEVVSRLRRERPDVEISLFESDDQAELLGRLLDGSLDLSFMTGPVADVDGIEMLPFVDDDFVLLSPAAEAITPPGMPVPTERLDALALVGQTPTFCQLVIEDGLRGAGVEPRVVFRTADNATVQAMVRSGMGHAVMPWLAIDPDDPGVAVRHLSPPLPPRTIGVALATQRRPTSAVLACIEIARQVCEERLGPRSAARSA